MGIVDVKFNRQGTKVAVSSLDSFIRVWDVATSNKTLIQVISLRRLTASHSKTGSWPSPIGTYPLAESWEEWPYTTPYLLREQVISRLQSSSEPPSLSPIITPTLQSVTTTADCSFSTERRTTACSNSSCITNRLDR
jgi:hypothetical protein